MDAADRGRLLFKLADLVEKNADELADARVAQLRQDDQRLEGRHGRGRQHPALLCRLGRQDRGPDRSGPRQLLVVHAAPAGGRGRPDHPLELPAPDAGLEVGPCPGLRQHRRAETGRANAADGALRVAELAQEAGFPAGVVNVVNGMGETTGAALVAHPGRRQDRLHRPRRHGQDHSEGRRRHPEADDLRAGRQEPQRRLRRRRPRRRRRRCVSRDLLPRRPVLHRRQPALRRRRKSTTSSSSASPKRPRAASSATRSIPRPSKAPRSPQEQLDKILHYVKLGEKQGATLVTGGERVGSKGFFVQPTIFDNVKDDMAIAKDEIFGPVVSVLPFQRPRRSHRPRQSDLLRTRRRDLDQGHRQGPPLTPRRSRPAPSGSTATTSSTPHTPFGGFKMSGQGRENGEAALEHYTELKTVTVKLNG